MEKEISLKEYQKEYRALEIKESKTSFVVHLIVYVIVNLGLMAINLYAEKGGAIWFVWPLAGWGFGVIMHFLFGVVFVEREFENREALAEKIARDKKMQN